MADEGPDLITVVIERTGRPRLGNLYGGEGKLHFEVTSSTYPTFDPNNNDESNNNGSEKSVKNLAAFDISDEGIRSIRVSPINEEGFNVELLKSNGLDAEKTASVQVIHKRMGTLPDSNDNLALVYLQPDRNLISDNCQPSTLSSFQGGSVFDGDATSITAVGLRDVFVSEEDLQRYCHFTFRFLPVRGLEPLESRASGTTMSEISTIDSLADEKEKSGGRGLGLRPLKAFDSDSEPDDDTESMQVLPSSLRFKSVFDDILSITIEIENQFTDSGPASPKSESQKAPGSGNGSPDFSFPYQNYGTPPSFMPRSSKVSDPSGTSHRSHQAENSSWGSSSNKTYLLRKFIKVNVKQRLQSLGVQQLDCNEIIDSWEARQHSPFFILPEDEENYNKSAGSNNTGIISPFISKPNSALFHLSPSGLITKSIFSTFVTQVDTLKGIMNNATCNLIHTSVFLLLPEIKLLWGHQLDTNRNPVFIHEWVRLIALAAIELKPSSPEDVAVMVNREFKTLKTLARQLYKSAKKIYLKITNLSRFSEDIFRRTLAHLNPKSLKKLDAFDIALKKKYSPDIVHFEPEQLHRINIAQADIFRDHIFVTETSKGELLIKNDIRGVWGKFNCLEFEERRVVFLALIEDLKENLRSCLHATQHLQEIYTTGYPCSIKNLLKDVVEELKFTAKRQDLTLLIKTSIVTHVSCLHEILTRLLYISQEVKGITKQFSESLNPVTFDLKKVKRRFKKREKPCSEFSETDVTRLTATPGGQHRSSAAGIGNSNAQLAIPFYNPNIDLSFKQT